MHRYYRTPSRRLPACHRFFTRYRDRAFAIDGRCLPAALLLRCCCRTRYSAALPRAHCGGPVHPATATTYMNVAARYRTTCLPTTFYCDLDYRHTGYYTAVPAAVTFLPTYLPRTMRITGRYARAFTTAALRGCGTCGTCRGCILLRDVGHACGRTPPLPCGRAVPSCLLPPTCWCLILPLPAGFRRTGCATTTATRAHRTTTCIAGCGTYRADACRSSPAAAFFFVAMLLRG